MSKNTWNWAELFFFFLFDSQVQKNEVFKFFKSKEVNMQFLSYGEYLRAHSVHMLCTNCYV